MGIGPAIRKTGPSHSVAVIRQAAADGCARAAPAASRACAEDRRIISSRTCGHTNLPPSSRLWISMPAKARRTITHDNGGEFARHEAVTDAIGLQAYFCDPHSPWQRGGLENANGRLRRDLPRKTSLADYTNADIDDAVWNLNTTPRKCLRYRTPIEAFAANLGVALEM